MSTRAHSLTPWLEAALAIIATACLAIARPAAASEAVPLGCPPTVKGDFNQDGKVDLVFRHISTNRHMIWHMNGVVRESAVWVMPDPPSTDWRVVGTDDFDSASAPGSGPDGKSDLVLHNTVTGAMEFWLMDANSRKIAISLTGTTPLSSAWKLSATGDFNGDGKPDLVWRNVVTQKLLIWKLNGTAYAGNIVPMPDQAVDVNWDIRAALDFNNDGARDLLWYNVASGRVAQWLMDATVARIAGRLCEPAQPPGREVQVAGDFGPGPGGMACTNDIVRRNSSSGALRCWWEDFACQSTDNDLTLPATPLADPGGNATDPLDWELVGPR
jgi:hypothetical protein